MKVYSAAKRKPICGEWSSVSDGGVCGVVSVRIEYRLGQGGPHSPKNLGLGCMLESLRVF